MKYNFTLFGDEFSGCRPIQVSYQVLYCISEEFYGLQTKMSKNEMLNLMTNKKNDTYRKILNEKIIFEIRVVKKFFFKIFPGCNFYLAK